MKKICIDIKFPFQLKCFVIAIACIGLSMFAAAQTEEEAVPQATSDTTVVEEEAGPEKVALRMGFDAFKINQDLKLLARVRSKVDTKFQNTAGVEVSFYKDEVDPSNLIGKDTSNQKGEASWKIVLPANKDSITSLTYWAVVKDHPDYDDAEETVTINPSVLTLELLEEDSLRTVKVFVGFPNDSGRIVPMAETEVKLFVRRLFGDMPLGDPETTDEEGYVTIEFPNDIKGDTAGMVTVVAKVMEHETLGNVETSESIAWGLPLEINDFYSQRQLWSARANSPIILIVVVNAAIIGIWGVILYIFLEIFRIRKLGKAN
jgi:hypothetical protein